MFGVIIFSAVVLVFFLCQPAFDWQKIMQDKPIIFFDVHPSAFTPDEKFCFLNPKSSKCKDFCKLHDCKE